MTIEVNDVVYEYNKQNFFVNTSLKNKSSGIVPACVWYCKERKVNSID